MQKEKKTVIAKYNDKSNRITGGKRYSVIGEIPNEFYKIINDDDQESFVYMHRFESEHLSNAKRIADEASALAERMRVRDNASEIINNACMQCGEIYSFVNGSGGGWRIKESGVTTLQSNNYEPNEYVNVLEQLREILRVPEGENIITHAKVVMSLADVLIDVFPGVKQ